VRTRQAGQSALLLLDVLDVIDRERIPYAVIGAMAAAFHGVPRASFDADLVISLAAGQSESLAETFKKEHFQVTSRKGTWDDPIPGLIELRDGFQNRVDVLTGLRGFDSEAFGRVVSTPLEDSTIRIVGLEDFIAMKTFAGSPKDLEDARGALAVSGTAVDLKLLEELVRRFGSDAVKNLKTLL
jgi:hypothetical protein